MFFNVIPPSHFPIIWREIVYWSQELYYSFLAAYIVIYRDSILRGVPWIKAFSYKGWYWGWIIYSLDGFVRIIRIPIGYSLIFLGTGLVLGICSTSFGLLDLTLINIFIGIKSYTYYMYSMLIDSFTTIQNYVLSYYQHWFGPSEYMFPRPELTEQDLEDLKNHIEKEKLVKSQSQVETPMEDVSGEKSKKDSASQEKQVINCVILTVMIITIFKVFSGS